jgi:hypothetical protein
VVAADDEAQHLRLVGDAFVGQHRGQHAHVAQAEKVLNWSNPVRNLASNQHK